MTQGLERARQIRHYHLRPRPMSETDVGEQDCQLSRYYVSLPAQVE
jgi:hypothetical protein